MSEHIIDRLDRATRMFQHRWGERPFKTLVFEINAADLRELDIVTKDFIERGGLVQDNRQECMPSAAGHLKFAPRAWTFKGIRLTEIEHPMPSGLHGSDGHRHLRVPV